ncbi:Transposase [Sphingobium herbicidovorans NBRC 16415]|uniref:Transposase n=1 Tax=Sphingobium herbicidovorans (strain ATCC 700291 / DSM 11019 / CCUG 56400 / KCTC 2939 / LMG 18315 / NBRC 16415 / MH) TaxID=1219045 RepID=A0A086PCD1_SPHHM|nr:Transposase [Sphingobium herbicidovorans NBRC 16415]
MRVIGMDVHRAFAQVAVLEGTQIVEQKRVELEHDTVVEFGRSLRPDDELVLEATGNTTAIVRLLSPFVRRVVIANPGEVRAIAHARVKTDKVDAVILAKLHASGFLPEVWAADDDTIGRRRMASERAALVRSVGRLKSRIQSILHTNLIPRYAGALFTKGGRIWLEKVPLPKDEKAMLFRHIDEFDRLTGQLHDLDRQLARRALDDPRARKLMTIAGVNAIVATTVLASIGEISRFESAQKLASYFDIKPARYVAVYAMQRASTAGTFLLVWKDHFLNACQVRGQRRPCCPAFPSCPFLLLTSRLLAKRLQFSTGDVKIIEGKRQLIFAQLF